MSAGRKKINLHTMSILIVDDVKTMRSIVRKMLKNLNIGNALHLAENGYEGLKILHSTRVDLAIIDWQMPIMNGLELLEAIRNDALLRDLPVLMVTAESGKEAVLEAAEIEVEGYLIKPLTPAVLDEKIRSIVHHANHPDPATIHIRNARILEERQDFNAAIVHMKRAVALKPAASRPLRNLGLLYQKTGDEKTMEKCLLRAASVNSQDVSARHLLGELYWENNDFVSTAQYYLELISLTRKFNNRAVELGEALLEKKMARLAKTIFSKVISSVSKDLPIKEKILDLCIKYDELEYSKTLLDVLLRESPSNHDLVYKAGIVYEMSHDLDKALEYFLTMDRYQGHRIDVKLRIAKLFYKKGKIIQADNFLNMVLKKDPSNEDALALRSRL